MDCFSDGEEADFPQIFGLFSMQLVHYREFEGSSSKMAANVEEVLVSRDDTHFHRLAREDLLIRKFAGNLLDERFVEQNDPGSRGDGVF
jgi:hypothetical protein